MIHGFNFGVGMVCLVGLATAVYSKDGIWILINALLAVANFYFAFADTDTRKETTKLTRRDKK